MSDSVRTPTGRVPFDLDTAVTLLRDTAELADVAHFRGDERRRGDGDLFRAIADHLAARASGDATPPPDFFKQWAAKPCTRCGGARNWSLSGQLQAVCYDCGHPSPAAATPTPTRDARSVDFIAGDEGMTDFIQRRAREWGVDWLRLRPAPTHDCTSCNNDLEDCEVCGNTGLLPDSLPKSQKRCAFCNDEGVVCTHEGEVIGPCECVAGASRETAGPTEALGLACKLDVIQECSDVFDQGITRFRAMRAALRHFASLLGSAASRSGETGGRTLDSYRVVQDERGQWWLWRGTHRAEGGILWETEGEAPVEMIPASPVGDQPDVDCVECFGAGKKANNSMCNVCDGTGRTRRVGDQETPQ